MVGTNLPLGVEWGNGLKSKLASLQNLKYPILMRVHPDKQALSEKKKKKVSWFKSFFWKISVQISKA